MVDAEGILALIDAALEGVGVLGPDPAISPDAMRWIPKAPAGASAPAMPEPSAGRPGPSPAALCTLQRLRDGTGALALRMIDGPAEGDVVAVPNRGHPPTGYRFAEYAPLRFFTSEIQPCDIPRLVTHDYVFAGTIMSDGSLAYKYAGRF